MSTRTESELNHGRRFVLAPNIAPDWRQTMLIFAGISTVCLGIGVVCAWFGLWPILPFAGIEVTALGWALYKSARRSLDREVIHVVDNAVVVEKGCGRVEERFEMDRTWTDVQLRRRSRRWDETQLLLRSRDRSLVIGAFLDADERRSLERALRACIGPMARWGDARPVTATESNAPERSWTPGLTANVGEKSG
jgi:uncharacterized membrane protein